MIGMKQGSRPYQRIIARSIQKSKQIQGRSAWILSTLFLVVPAYAATSHSQLSFVLTPTFSNNQEQSSITSSPLHNAFPRPQRTFTTTSLDMVKLESPSAQRNKGPIWDLLSQKVFSPLSTTSDRPLRILEIAAGSGVHVDHFASQLSAFSSTPFKWFPTDPDLPSRNSIESYVQDNNLKDIGVQPPLPLTLNRNGIIEPETVQTLFPTGEESLDLMICINMIHISPWEATLGLLKLAGERLDPDRGILFCYGPYKEGGTAVESNL